jgi:hypothetical protein
MASIDDPEYAPPRELPFPPGTSPFRQRGAGYLADVRYYDAVVRGGHQAVIDAIPEASVRSFFRQPFRTSEWYDAYPGAVIEVAAARVRAMTFERHRRNTGAWHARDAVHGIYAALLKILSTENIAVWAPRISSIYFEFGKTTSKVTGPREVIGSRRGIPKDLVQWLIFASAGFVETTLQLGGAKNPTVTVVDIAPDGRDHMRDMMRVDLRLKWDA